MSRAELTEGCLSHNKVVQNNVDSAHSNDALIYSRSKPRNHGQWPIDRVYLHPSKVPEKASKTVWPNMTVINALWYPQ